MPWQAAGEAYGATAPTQNSSRLPPLAEPSSESRRKLRQLLLLLLLLLLLSLPLLLAAALLASSLVLPSPRGDRGFC
jgi:hypothetical protein